MTKKFQIKRYKFKKFNSNLYKIPFRDKPIINIENYLLNKLPGKYFIINVWSRRSIITKLFVGIKVNIHSGRRLVPLIITNYMVGHRFGEFIFTKRMSSLIHFNKKKKKKKNF